MNHTHVTTRRSFVAAAGAAACAATVTGALATSQANAEEVSGFDQNFWLGEEPQIDDADVIETLTADVVVVGLSDSGCCATRAAVEGGASVIAIEKSEGINSCGSGAAIIGGSLEKRWGREVIDRDLIIDRHMEECQHKCKRTIMSRFVYGIGDMFDWFLEACPETYIADTYTDEIPDEGKDNFIVPSFLPAPEGWDWREEQIPTYPVTIDMSNLKALLTDQYNRACEEGEVQALFGHFAEKLIMQDGRCCGVYARDAESGSYKKVMANKGVILCTGDYSSNRALLERFTPEIVERGIQTVWINRDVEGNLTNDGSGLRMGAWAGAVIQKYHAPATHHMGGGADVAGKGVMGINGYLQLNRDGKRFMNEDIPGQQLENQIEIQPDGFSYQFFDARWPEQVSSFPAQHGGACYYLDPMPQNNTSVQMSARNQETLQQAIDDGRCLVADSIEELLAQIPEIDAQTAAASIERYNELCEAGVDEDFAKNSKRLFPLVEAPFYACRFDQTILLVCMGGLESDEDCHTFDAEHNVIPGLYVAGNMQGDRFADTYPISLRGASVGMALFFGYIAGQNAAAGI